MTNHATDSDDLLQNLISNFSLQSVSLLLQAHTPPPSKSTLQILCSSVVSRFMEELHLPATVLGTCFVHRVKIQGQPRFVNQTQSWSGRQEEKWQHVTLSTAKRCLGRRHMVRHTGTSSEEQKQNLKTGMCLYSETDLDRETVPETDRLTRTATKV